MNKKILIIGASRGLGMGLVKEYLKKGYEVFATERKIENSTELKKLKNISDEKLHVDHLEMNNEDEIKKLRIKLSDLKFDILFVNAGVCDDSTKLIKEISTETFDWVMHTNALSPIRVIETLDDLVVENGTIVAMSSGLGSIATNFSGGYELYRASKAALNMFLKSYSIRAGKKRSIIAMMPGWVRTDMGGLNAPLDVETSAKGMAYTIDINHAIPGIKFIDYTNKSIPW